ncbi:MAG: Lrp/AsnC family transcriptional regulator [Fidelibacterota bacterium]
MDRKILEILQTDGRITNSKLAEKIGISPPPTLERVKKLERHGVIQRYVCLLNPEKVGIETFTFVEVTLSRHGSGPVKRFITAVNKIGEILECHHVTGEADFLLKIAVHDIPAYESLVLYTLTNLPGVQHLKTMVVLSTTKKETALPLFQNDKP